MMPLSPHLCNLINNCLCIANRLYITLTVYDATVTLIILLTKINMHYVYLACWNMKCVWRYKTYHPDFWLIFCHVWVFAVIIIIIIMQRLTRHVSVIRLTNRNMQYGDISAQMFSQELYCDWNKTCTMDFSWEKLQLIYNFHYFS